MESLTIKSLEVAVAALPKMQGMLLEKAVLQTAFALVKNKADWTRPDQRHDQRHSRCVRC